MLPYHTICSLAQERRRALLSEATRHHLAAASRANAIDDRRPWRARVVPLSVTVLIALLAALLLVEQTRAFVLPVPPSGLPAHQSGLPGHFRGGCDSGQPHLDLEGTE